MLESWAGIPRVQDAPSVSQRRTLTSSLSVGQGCSSAEAANTFPAAKGGKTTTAFCRLVSEKCCPSSA